MDLNFLVSNIGAFTDDAVLICEAEPVTSPGPRIVWCNAAFEVMSGYTREEIIGKTPRILHGPETSPETRREVSEGLRAWKVIHAEILNYRKDGTPFWVDLHIQPVPDETGWYRYWIAIQRNITSRKTVTEEVRSRLEVLDAQHDELTSFAARVSHDLREPLRKISVFADLLLRAVDARNWDDVRAAAETIKSASRRGSQMVTDILRLSMASHVDLQLEPVDCRELIGGVLDDFRSRINELGVTVVQDVEAVALPADRAALSHVVRNLIGNCIKHRSMEKPPKIEITGRPHGHRYILAFTDNGIGIPPDQGDAIFEPYFALNNREGKSSGLGLSIVKTLTEKCGWHIDYISRLGEGTSFRLGIPIQVGG